MSDDTNPCRACPDRPFHMPDCSCGNRAGVRCDCGASNVTGKEWKCGDCESRRFHLSSCSVFNEPAMPVGPCTCGNNYNPEKTALEILGVK